MRNNTPVAPQGIKIPPLPETPVRYETAEGWSMAFVSDDTILVAERGGQIKVVRNGVVDPQPVPGAPVARGQGLSGMDLALHPNFDRNHAVYISYTKPLDEKRNTRTRKRSPSDFRSGAVVVPNASCTHWPRVLPLASVSVAAEKPAFERFWRAKLALARLFPHRLMPLKSWDW